MKIKIIFVVVAAVALGIGATVGSWMTHRIDKVSYGEVIKVYQTQNQECRTDRNELASKARFLISQKLYVRKVKNGQVTYDPQSTMEISRFIDEINELDSIESKINLIPVDSIKPKLKFWDKIKLLFH